MYFEHRFKTNIHGKSIIDYPKILIIIICLPQCLFGCFANCNYVYEGRLNWIVITFPFFKVELSCEVKGDDTPNHFFEPAQWAHLKINWEYWRTCNKEKPDAWRHEVWLCVRLILIIIIHISFVEQLLWIKQQQIKKACP